jgi:hypothetical protein
MEQYLPVPFHKGIESFDQVSDCQQISEKSNVSGHRTSRGSHQLKMCVVYGSRGPV